MHFAVYLCFFRYMRDGDEWLENPFCKLGLGSRLCALHTASERLSINFVRWRR